MLLYLVNSIDRICCACMILLNVVLDTSFTVYMEVVSHVAYYIMFLYFLGIVYFCI